MLKSNIVRLRKQKGLTQMGFAKALGVSQSAVSHWETGRSYPETPQLFQLAEFFDVSIDDLVGEDDYYPRPQSTPPLMLDDNPVMGWADDMPETQAIARELYAMALNIGATKEDVDAFRNYLLLTKGQQNYINNSMKFLRSQRNEEKGT